MKVVLHSQSPAEKRLLSAFLNDLADLQEVERANATAHLRLTLEKIGNEPLVQPPVDNDHVAEGCEKFEEPAPAKKTRSKKTQSATGAEPAVESGSPDAPADVGNDPAPTASAEDGGSTEDTSTNPVSPAVTHDTLKLLYGQMVQAGKRDAVVAAVKSFGFGVIRDIPADKLEEVYAAMKAVG